MATGVALDEYIAHLERAFAALERRDYEAAGEVMAEWLAFVGCIGVELDRLARRVCRRACKRETEPECGCLADAQYAELVAVAKHRCLARGDAHGDEGG